MSSDLPARPINVIVEDYKNPELLFVGNDSGVYVSIDGGKHWAPLKGNMPTVPVHDLVIHPRDCDLIAGTYGRGIWVTNIGLLRELTESVLTEDIHFFAVQPRARRNDLALGGYRLYGDRQVVTQNDINGLALAYYLKSEAKGKVTFTVTKPSGTVIRTIEGAGKAGINHVIWNLGGTGFQPGGQSSAGRLAAAPLPVAPGEYEVTLQVGERKLTQKAVVRSARGEESGLAQDK